MRRQVLTHGGASSSPAHRDGPEKAARRALRVLREGGTPLDAACEATVLLEDDPRFNAGTGSSLRFDGRTIEMDASCMDGTGRFGAVAALREVKNPVLVARAVLDTPHNLVVGEGALALARRLGHPFHDPTTPQARERYQKLVDGCRKSGIDFAQAHWDLARLRQCWNYDEPLDLIVGSKDTVGAVATDGHTFAAALSTGGTMATLLGRVGDTPLPGCGLMAGAAGAVALTGDGDVIGRLLLARRVYGWLEEGMDAEKAKEEALRSVPEAVDLGIILLGRDGGWSAGSNREMAWAHVQED